MVKVMCCQSQSGRMCCCSAIYCSVTLRPQLLQALDLQLWQKNREWIQSGEQEGASALASSRRKRAYLCVCQCSAGACATACAVSLSTSACVDVKLGFKKAVEAAEQPDSHRRCATFERWCAARSREKINSKSAWLIVLRAFQARPNSPPALCWREYPLELRWHSQRLLTFPVECTYFRT